MSSATTRWVTPFPGYEIPTHWPVSDAQRQELLTETWDLVLAGVNVAAEYVELLDFILDETSVSDQEAEDFFSSVIDRRRSQQRLLGGPPQSISLILSPNSSSGGYSRAKTFSVVAIVA